MSLIDLKNQAKQLMLDYVSTLPEKEYTGIRVDWDGASDWIRENYKSRQHFGWVYVIALLGEPNKCKIGYTDNCPVERARKIFSGQYRQSDLYVLAFSSNNARAYKVERYIQSILYACGLQSVNETIGGLKAKSGGTEIFDLAPTTACSLIEDAITNLQFT